MFERRLKIFTAAIIVLSLTLFGRVFTVQVVQHSDWQGQAIGLLTRPMITETTRGRILDIHGIPLAVDVPSTDACVDYRAILNPPDPKWVQSIALSRLRNRIGAEYRSAKADQRKVMLVDEIKQTLRDINLMWETLAVLNPNVDEHGDRPAEMATIRQEIVQSVQDRRKKIASYHLQLDQAKETVSSRWLRWLSRSDVDDGSDTDNLAVIQEQQEPHVILPALDPEACNLLGKRLEHLPGLQLRASTHRLYPLNNVACHLMGSMARVNDKDLASAKKNKLDELHTYGVNDLIGREGIEGLCEPLLRGVRGKIETRVSDKSEASRQDFVPGSDVQLSIDADLQQKAQMMLQHVVEYGAKIDEDRTRHRALITPAEGVSMHAAIVVLDVKTNEVRVLASNPGFDVNQLQDRYADLISDKVNEPLRNRATCDEFEPGSTVKPLIGLGAITQGILGASDTIECTGSLYLPAMSPDGKPYKIKMPRGRCWVVSEFAAELKLMHSDGSHHPIPSAAPHPTGFLTFADALERSCDIYFETVADRLTPSGVNYWYDQFGLGRTTGIGIYERPGLRPGLWKGSIQDSRMNNCWAGMGQGTAWATPLQIANEAATLARGGVWMRPRLLTQASQDALDAANPRPSGAVDSVDLHLNAGALTQARIGMVNSVDSPAGTGRIEHPADVTVAAKTGTADASPIWHTVIENGKPVKRKLQAVARFSKETSTPWYRSTDEKGEQVVHSWFMGYAPAENPQIAFCVLIEYAGAAGGAGAGPVASQVLEACRRAGYLHPNQGAPSGNPMAFRQ